MDVDCDFEDGFPFAEKAATEAVCNNTFGFWCSKIGVYTIAFNLRPTLKISEPTSKIAEKRTAEDDICDLVLKTKRLQASCEDLHRSSYFGEHCEDFGEASSKSEAILKRKHEVDDASEMEIQPNIAKRTRKFNKRKTN